MTRPWNYHSHATACSICGGAGVVDAYRQPTIDDPYPQEGCECGQGEHEPECAVCGFDQIIPGYDCLVCDTVASLHERDLLHFTVASFAAAWERAQTAALADFARAAQAQRAAA